jgi:cardiolipin synthase A/B
MSRQAIKPALKPDQYSWRFYLKSNEAWDAMYRDCEQATSSIELEQYIHENDPLGQRFLKLFIRKAREGIRVFVICDKFGSLKLYGSPLVRKLRKSGGYFCFYNPITRWDIFKPWRWFPRTHTKTLLIDSRVAYAGGVCMAARMYGWRDTQVRVTGPVVTQVRRAFDEIEKRNFGKKARHDNIIVNLSTVEARRRFAYLLNQPRFSKHAVYDALVHAVANSRKYIYITTAYFIPNEHFFGLLEEAHRRGVEIMVMVPQFSDVPVADWLCLSYFGRLLDTGVRVFLYQESILHSKTAVIDDSWATVGSTNFDVISFFHNREANLVVTDKAAIADLKAHFLRDLLYSRELTREGWQQIPLWKKMAGRATRLIKIFF